MTIKKEDLLKENIDIIKHLIKENIISPAMEDKFKIDPNAIVPLEVLNKIYKSAEKSGTKTGIKVPSFKFVSGYQRDQPFIANFSQSSPENFAGSIIFVLLTIRADFMQAVQDYPVIMLKLFSHHDHHNEERPMSRDYFEDEILKLQGRLGRKVVPSMKDDSGRLTGYSLGTTTFGFKYDGITEVWNKRKSLYGKAMELAHGNKITELFELLYNNVTGLGPAKAGFVVQLIFGKLGCIDMHNINLYSKYAKVTGNVPLYDKLDPKRLQKLGSYLEAMKALEDEGVDTVKMWDIWTGYVASNYVKSSGVSRYDVKNPLSGSTVDPKSAIAKKLSAIDSPIEDRNSDYQKPTLFKPDFYHPGAGTASAAHSVIWHPRSKSYYWAVLRKAEGGETAPGIRIDSGYDKPYKLLAYMYADPSLLNSVFKDDEEGRKEFLERLKTVMQKHGLISGKDYLPFGSDRNQLVMPGFVAPSTAKKAKNPSFKSFVSKKDSSKTDGSGGLF